ncbi:MAG: M48 family metalloprotease, partial [Nevskiaceae bacterium]|nr:M48 family metalloprotease [Nevskiaceae bacterium]
MKWKRLTTTATLLAAMLVLAACGVNPVTGKREIQFVSETQELQLGEKEYAPTRQSEGGDYELLPDLTTYVNEVGQKLAAVADRKLPYEFKVLNSSVPNAWALPGGKIAVNRGLLMELKNEAELAAVLGHEIVHAAARHGAKAQERGTLMQAGLAAAQIGAAMGGVDQQMAGLVLGGASVGAQMVQMRYGRDQELESDLYGMRYMKAAGYDPSAAISLQETFVRLSQGQGQQDWLSGLFASHPPSQERVERNRQTAQQLGAGGDLGTERYVARVAPLMKLKPAYDRYDEAQAALAKQDLANARRLAGEAAKLEPREGRFQQLLGDIELSAKRDREALPFYQKAVQLSPGYFGSWLGAGVAEYRSGNKTQAKNSLAKSMELLPTAPAALYLGNLTRDAGDTAGALSYYQAATSAQGDIGKEAAREAMLLDLPKNPGNYIAAALRTGSDGRPMLVVENRAPVALGSIAVTPVLVNSAGQV